MSNPPNFEGKASHAVAFLLGLKGVSKGTLSSMMRREMGTDVAEILTKYAMGSMQDLKTLQDAMTAGAALMALGYLLRAGEDEALCEYARAVNNEPKN